jgi:uncharacterized membrane protein YphA (DoxX/SURF4 family)
MSSRYAIALRVASVVLGLLFCAAGVPKIIGGPAVVDQFANWGYPAWFPRIIGVGETLGGVALLIPRFAQFGAALVIAIMVGAAFTHVRAAEWLRLPLVVALGLVAFGVFRAQSHRGRVAAGQEAP